MRQLLDGRIGKLTVVHEDRLLRFGVDLIRQVCRKVLTDIEVLEVSPEKTFEEELARDVIISHDGLLRTALRQTKPPKLSMPWKRIIE